MNKPEFKTYIISTWELFQSLRKYANEVDSDILVYDVETDGVIEKLCNNYGFGVCFTENKAFYVPWRNSNGTLWWNENQQNQIIDWLYNTSKNKKLIGHNIIFDILVTKNNFNIDLTDFIYHDTILSKHTTDENPPFNLKDLAVIELGSWADKSQEQLKEAVLQAGGKWTKDQKDMYLAPTEILGEYCCFDVILTLKLYNIYNERLEKEGLTKFFYEDEVMPLYKLATIPMKDHGFPIDVDHFKRLKHDITNEIDKLEVEMYNLIENDIKDFQKDLLNKEFPPKTSGNFPKAMAEITGIPLPINKKTGGITLSKSAIQKQSEAAKQYKLFYDWILNEKSIDINSPTFKTLFTKSGCIVKDTQLHLWKKKYDTDKIFNLKSNDHLIELLFNVWNLQPLERTEKGKPKVDDGYLETLKGNPFIDKLLDYKKLNKLLSTYVDGILDRQINGKIYTSMLQFGTTSSRFASRNPNLNNLPSAKKIKTLADKYANEIRKGFIALPGYKIIGIDYNALEPHLAAYVSEDEGLIDIFVNNKDFYSAIGIKQFNIVDAYPYKDDSEDSFPVKYKELRNKIKTYALAAFYGAQEAKIAETLKCSYQEAKVLLEGYFISFPKIKRFISITHNKVKNEGIIKTKLGRVRHLNDAKAIYSLYGDDVLDYKYAKKRNLLDTRRKYKNALNNAVNFQIQGLAASCLNRAMIFLAKEIKTRKLDAKILLSVHDELLIVAKEEISEEVAQLAKHCMETCVDINPIKLKATPVIGDSYGDSK